eukprot:gene24559-biopygen17928
MGLLGPVRPVAPVRTHPSGRPSKSTGPRGTPWDVGLGCAAISICIAGRGGNVCACGAVLALAAVTTGFRRSRRYVLQRSQPGQKYAGNNQRLPPGQENVGDDQRSQPGQKCGE